MTVEAEPSSHRTRGDRDVSGIVVNTLIGLVHASSGNAGVAQTLALASDDRSFAELGDPEGWSSLDHAVSLFNAGALVTGDGAIGLHVGDGLLFRTEVAEFAGRLRTLEGPSEVLDLVGPLVAFFESTSDAVALEVATDHALVSVATRGSHSRHAHLCEMTRGLLAQIPTLFGLDPALITETECGARGGRYCLYAMSWDDPWTESEGETGGPSTVDHESPSDRPQSDPAPEHSFVPLDQDVDKPPVDPLSSDVVDPSVAELKAELKGMSVLIEGAFAAALDLLGDDVASHLAQIAARADAVVTAHRYLLMVRVRPDARVQLHHRGLEPDEAQMLAAELWNEDPDDADGSRLIVDIASPECRYGRLVEFAPEGATHPASELRVLQLFAEHAATTLHVFNVVSDAKRSDATARTLLSFSEALSRVTNLADLAQLLADTVPEVTDCDRSTVYLWDSTRGALVPQAYTNGSGPLGAFVGPIVPISNQSRPIDRLHLAADHEVPLLRPTGTDGDIGSTPGSASSKSSSGSDGHLPLNVDDPVIKRMIHDHEVLVIDGSTDDPFLRNLLDQSQSSAAVAVPLFAAGEFLGVIAANFSSVTPATSIRDADLHERLSGLADQAATALQNLDLLDRVRHMAWHDALTGLPNRRLFEDRVEQELVRSRRVGEPVCMFFVDLDHFKTVNDTLGHAAGDDLIQQVSQRLVDTVRRQDTVARVGGDEFAILLPGLSDQLAIDQLAQRSLEAIGEPFFVFGVEVETSASIGVAMAPDHGDSYDELLSRADEAMYRAKARGRNAFQMFSTSMINPDGGRQVIDERTLYADLVHALERGEFFVLYQPYIDLRTAQVTGVEALVRWDHPTLGVLEPSSFISMAERSDIIVALDAWVLDETCRQARAWMDHGLPPLRLSVNVASRDLSNPDLFDNITSTLEETGIEPSLLELEITERVVLDESGPARKSIEQLRRLGVRFTIDNFGTGNSSLSRIGSFPVSTLKIDQSFVQVLGPEGDNNSLVSAIISMADRLGLNCVAEGVETSLQSRMLLQRGCTTAQGYYFSQPLSGAEVEDVIANIAETGKHLDLDENA